MEFDGFPPVQHEEPKMTSDGGNGFEWFILLLAGIFLALALSGCRSVKYVPVERTVTDSVVYRDTLVSERLVPYKDSVAVQDTTSYLSNKYAYSTATWSNGTLSHVLAVFPLAKIEVKVPNYAERIRTIREPQIVEVEKKLTWMQQKKLDYFGLSFAANILLIPVILWLIRKKGGSR